MSSISNIAVYDGAGTPVLHTLLPVSVSRDKNKVTAEWREQASGVPVIAQVRCRMTLERLSSGVYKVESRTEVPVQEVVTGSNSAGYSAPAKVAFVDTVIITGLFHERESVTGRRLARQLAVNIAGGVTTSVTPVTAGPLPELFDMLVAPT